MSFQDLQAKSFEEKDKETVLEFLKLLASKGKFDDMKVEDSIKLTQQITWMQRVLIPKIDAHVFEIKAIKEQEEPKPKAKKGKK